ncbi:hypothetical protein GCM10022226_50540 [Sphaerisporangium flaviroseum]|uniref:Coenzyme Q-binding protein COQ10 START domain-containing protein n=1 Tax=Sphaerisporangium flaviroseum TaxID=509199 RepID=A0ABP7IPZ9_9ACTN
MSDRYDRTTNRLARGLGWASLGLGVTQLAAPKAVIRLSGLEDSASARPMVLLVGMRELLHAAFLLGSRRPAPWVWTRVAGDALDLSLLRRAMATRRRRRVAFATAAVAGVTAVDLYVGIRANRLHPQAVPAMRLHAAITVHRPREEAYRFWHDFENLPRFMAHLESVHVIAGGYSHWSAKGPLNTTISWDAELVEDRPGELIAWRSAKGSVVPNRGMVRFADAPGGRGTEVRVALEFDSPGGRAGLAFARLLGEHPEQQVRDDLRRFKQVMETGEVVRSEGSPEGVRALRQAMQRPAQPVK